MVTDSLIDMISRIRNGVSLKLKDVLVIKSAKVKSVLDVLYLEGFIAGYTLNCEDPRKIRVFLKYNSGGLSVLKDIKSISRSGKRVYLPVKVLWNLHSSYNFNCFILSTSKGVLSLKSALKLKVGGELLCYVG